MIPGIQGVVYGLAIILVILLAPEGVFWRVRDRLCRGDARGRTECTKPNRLSSRTAGAVPLRVRPGGRSRSSR